MHIGWNQTIFLHHLPRSFTIQECDQLLSEQENFHPATILQDTDDGVEQIVDTTYRHHDRSMGFDTDLSVRLYEKVKDTLPPVCFDEEKQPWKLVKMNPFMRYLRYSPGQFFKAHQDEATELLDNNEGANGKLMSFITLQLYLSDNTEGATAFYQHFPLVNHEKNDISTPDVKILPRKGDVVLFQHDLIHEGQPLLKEYKYTLRTDVLYRKA
ncbi:MAG: 2OG-Fe(II) oxygenase [Sphingobacteriaceae bacterium]|nr:MAG: 2OG-Fe(II) oxygenase [Sphingobacteriaceae bacterium]